MLAAAPALEEGRPRTSTEQPRPDHPEEILLVPRGGRSLVLCEPGEGCATAGPNQLAVERCDGEPVGETDVMLLPLEAGFLAGPLPPSWR